jgi:hypothetical protein
MRKERSARSMCSRRQQRGEGLVCSAEKDGAVKSWTIWTTAETLTKTDLPPGPNLDRLDRQVTSSSCKDRMSLEVDLAQVAKGGKSIGGSTISRTHRPPSLGRTDHSRDIHINQRSHRRASETLGRGCADFVLSAAKLIYVIASHSTSSASTKGLSKRRPGPGTLVADSSRIVPFDQPDHLLKFGAAFAQWWQQVKAIPLCGTELPRPFFGQPGNVSPQKLTKFLFSSGRYSFLSFEKST